MNKKTIISAFLCAAGIAASAQTTGRDSLAAQTTGTATAQTEPQDTTYREHRLGGVTVKSAATRRMGGALNGMVIGRDELFKAACCNLGESFTQNPSVDVNYSDATTGARQIKLLGLSGTYVQMLTENMPNYRGSSTPYALGYVPGPWMKSIQVSKGCASVKNGYESISGQININFLQPEDETKTELNLYGDTKSRIEANVTTNFHLNPRLSAEVLAHYEDSWEKHDDNGDGFIDKPAVRQGHLQTRWAYLGDKYIFHGGIAALKEKRTGGQTSHSHSGSTEAGGADNAGAATTTGQPLFNIGIETSRYEAYAKNAFVLNRETGANIALMTQATMHEQDAAYGLKLYRANEKNLYASLMYEANLTPRHNLSVGLSLNHDYLSQRVRLTADDKLQPERLVEKETVPGAYAQYTFDLDHRITLMAGLRIDHSSIYGTFLTPRFNLKLAPADLFSIRLSAGKGYRTPHALAEYNYLMASGRKMQIADLNQEEAWNYGAALNMNIPLWGRTLKLNLDYFYTRFHEQTVIDYDSDPTLLSITNLQGRSYSHTFQVDASYEPVKGLTVTAAYRLNDVKTTFGGELMEKPLTSKYKGLLSLSYKTPLELWQFDATLQLNGGGRMPKAYTTGTGAPSWPARFSAYEQLSMQVTRWFRHFSVYVGGENLTNFKQRQPIIAASEPWSDAFEPTLVWGPVHGRMFYAGVRVNF